MGEPMAVLRGTEGPAKGSFVANSFGWVGAQWFASLDPNRWRFGIARRRIVGRTATSVHVAGISHRRMFWGI